MTKLIFTEAEMKEYKAIQQNIFNADLINKDQEEFYKKLASLRATLESSTSNKVDLNNPDHQEEIILNYYSISSKSKLKEAANWDEDLKFRLLERMTDSGFKKSLKVGLDKYDNFKTFLPGFISKAYSALKIFLENEIDKEQIQNLNLDKVSTSFLLKLQNNIGPTAFTEDAYSLIQLKTFNSIRDESQANSKNSESNLQELKKILLKDSRDIRLTKNEIARLNQFSNNMGILLPEMDSSSQDDKVLLENVNKILIHAEEEAAKEQTIATFTGMSEAFGAINALGTVFKSRELQVAGKLGQASVSLVLNIAKLTGGFAGIAQVTGLAALGPAGGAVMAALSMISLFVDKEEDTSNQLLFEQLQMIQSQIAALHKDMQEGFIHLDRKTTHIIRQQQYMIEMIGKVQESLQFLSRKSSDQYTQINSKLNELLYAVEQSGRQNFIKNLNSICSRIERLSQLELTKSEEMLLTLEDYLAVHSSDTLLTGATGKHYIAVGLNDKRVVEKLSSIDLFNKMGFMLELANQDNKISAESIVNPYIYLKAFYSYRSLIYKLLANKQIPSITQKQITKLTAPAIYTLEFLKSTRHSEFIMKLFADYENSFNNVVNYIRQIMIANKIMSSKDKTIHSRDDVVLVHDIQATLDSILAQSSITHPLYTHAVAAGGARPGVQKEGDYIIKADMIIDAYKIFNSRIPSLKPYLLAERFDLGNIDTIFNIKRNKVLYSVVFTKKDGEKIHLFDANKLINTDGLRSSFPCTVVGEEDDAWIERGLFRYLNHEENVMVFYYDSQDQLMAKFKHNNQWLDRTIHLNADLAAKIGASFLFRIRDLNSAHLHEANRQHLRSVVQEITQWLGIERSFFSYSSPRYPETYPDAEYDQQEILKITSLAELNEYREVESLQVHLPVVRQQIANIIADSRKNVAIKLLNEATTDGKELQEKIIVLEKSYLILQTFLKMSGLSIPDLASVDFNIPLKETARTGSANVLQTFITDASTRVQTWKQQIIKISNDANANLHYISGNTVENQLFQAIKQLEIIGHLVEHLKLQQNIKAFPNDAPQSKSENLSNKKSEVEGNSLVHDAIKNCNIRETEELIRRRVTVNEVNADKKSPLDLALECLDSKKRKSIVIQLIKTGAILCREPLKIAPILDEYLNLFDDIQVIDKKNEFFEYHRIKKIEIPASENQPSSLFGFMFANAQPIPNENLYVIDSTPSYGINFISMISAFGRWLFGGSNIPKYTNNNLDTERFISIDSPSFDSTILLTRVLMRHSAFTLPHNKTRYLTQEDIEILNQHLKTLDKLKISLNLKMKKRACIHGINTDMYSDTKNLLNQSQLIVHQMLQANLKTSDMFSVVENNIERIQNLLPKLTNRDLEKALRHEEIRQERNLRRRGRVEDNFPLPRVLNHSYFWSKSHNNFSNCISANTTDNLFQNLDSSNRVTQS